MDDQFTFGFPRLYEANFAYNGLGQLTSADNSRSGELTEPLKKLDGREPLSTISDYSLGYDNAGNRTSVAFSLPGVSEDSFQYDYSHDLSGRTLTRHVSVDDNMEYFSNFYYDGHGRLRGVADGRTDLVDFDGVQLPLVLNALRTDGISHAGRCVRKLLDSARDVALL